jgi:hypothetical protein
MSDTNPTSISPGWPSPQHEIAVLRAALHALVRDTLAGQAIPDHVVHDEQAVVDYYIAQARGQSDRDQ